MLDIQWWRSPNNARVDLLVAVARTAAHRHPGFAIANYFISHKTPDTYLEIYSTNSTGARNALAQLNTQEEEYVIRTLIHNLEPFELDQTIQQLDLDILSRQRKIDCDLLRAKRRLDWMLLHKQARIIPDANSKTKIDILKLLNDEARETIPTVERVDPQVLAACMILEYSKRSFVGFSKNAQPPRAIPL